MDGTCFWGHLPKTDRPVLGRCPQKTGRCTKKHVPQSTFHPQTLDKFIS